MAEKIGIVGAGIIGRAWAIVFARAGHAFAIHEAAPNALAAYAVARRGRADAHNLGRDAIQ